MANKKKNSLKLKSAQELSLGKRFAKLYAPAVSQKTATQQAAHLKAAIYTIRAEIMSELVVNGASQTNINKNFSSYFLGFMNTFARESKRAANQIGKPLKHMGVTADASMRELLTYISKQNQIIHYSEDGRTIELKGKEYSQTPLQGQVFLILVEEHKNGSPWQVKNATVFAAGSVNGHWNDVFKGHHKVTEKALYKSRKGQGRQQEVKLNLR